ncbi:ATPase ASNA1-like protein isoform X3 [Hibiscus syriacus]|uniref:ATPase ASNA1-like protein isoform X3 n=1 Tax=Hibiscus syriacus TaxID=106335 RepID=A0A6A2ZZ90_HIBSY|nr:ATPase ASNA1-like protein isoform X3 [Hibiscus syriacus]
MLSRCFRSISRIPGNLIPNTISHYTPKPQNNIPSHRTKSIFTSVPHTVPFLVRSVATILDPAARFDEMIIGPQRKYYFLGGKGGVGKTSCAASLAVKFADHGHPTIVISTDPAHSLSDSFSLDLAGGNLVSIDGLNSPLLALEINPDKAKEEFQSASQKNGGSAVKDFMNNMGLGMLADQLGDLKLGELLDTPPPGLDEAIAISKACTFFDPFLITFSVLCLPSFETGHTLRFLSLPDFLDASIGKIMKFKKKLASATSAIKSVLGKAEERKDVPDKLQLLRERMTKVRDLFRDSNTTEFVIVTIPSVMAVNESSRLHASLRKECVPVHKLIVNQILPPSVSDCKFCTTKRKEQMRAIEMIRNDPELANLRIIEAPLVDLEIRGIPALKFMGDIVWA